MPFIEEQLIDLSIVKKNTYPSIRDALLRLGLKVRFRAIQSEDYVTGVSGWKIWDEDGVGKAEFQIIIAGSYVNCFRQASAPTAVNTGDIWLDSDDGDKLYRWSGSAWVEVQDDDIATAIADAATAQAEADRKIVTFIQASAPTAEQTGDIWIDSDDDNKPYRWSGSAWVAAEFDAADWAKIFGGNKPDDNADVTLDALAIQSFYGDGSDGDLSTTGDVNLTRDMFYNDLTVNNGHTIDTKNYRLFVKGTLTVNSGGTIKNSGAAGTNGGNGADCNGSSAGGSAGVGGAATPAGSIPASVAGVDGKAGASGTSSNTGANGDNGNNGNDQAKSVGSAGVAGGAGGTGGDSPRGSGGSGGSGGSAGSQTGTVYNKPFNAVSAYLFYDYSGAAQLGGSAGSASGGGGGNGSGYTGSHAGGAGGGSGGSGAAGGILMIFAKTVVNNGSIQANGGDGGDGGNGGAGTDTGDYLGAGGGGAGGSGGSGGVVILVYSTKSGSAPTVTGGTGGTGGSAGTPSYDATPTAGANGTNGNAGVIIYIQI